MVRHEDDIAVSAHGSGNVLLETLSGAVTASAEILSGTGHISILSTGAALVDDTDSMTTSGAGSITLISSAGTITQNEVAR